jgi:predicted thioredoxin/glutaredoxin
VLALIDSKDPKQYIQRMKQRDEQLKEGWVQIVRALSVETAIHGIFCFYFWRIVYYICIEDEVYRKGVFDVYRKNL